MEKDRMSEIYETGIPSTSTLRQSIMELSTSLLSHSDSIPPTTPYPHFSLRESSHSRRPTWSVSSSLLFIHTTKEELTKTLLSPTIPHWKDSTSTSKPQPFAHDQSVDQQTEPILSFASFHKREAGKTRGIELFVHLHSLMTEIVDFVEVTFLYGVGLGDYVWTPLTFFRNSLRA